MTAWWNQGTQCGWHFEHFGHQAAFSSLFVSFFDFSTMPPLKRKRQELHPLEGNRVYDTFVDDNTRHSKLIKSNIHYISFQKLWKCNEITFGFSLSNFILRIRIDLFRRRSIWCFVTRTMEMLKFCIMESKRCID